MINLLEKSERSKFGTYDLSSSLSHATLEIFRNLPSFEDFRIPIWERESYLSYLEELLTNRSEQGIINPHKATIQLEMTKQNISEDTTRIVDPRHVELLLGYTLKLLKDGKREVWWSLADKDDIADPQGDTRFSPPLFKNITMSNIGKKFEELQKYLKDHPESLVKIFPQDGEHPSLCSLILVDEPSEKRLNFKIRPHKYTTDERSEAEDPIEINIDLGGSKPIIMINDKKDLKWIRILMNSKKLFENLDKINLKGSNFTQPELMAYGNSFKFFTDVIWGDKFDKTPDDIPCPKFAPIIEQLSDAKIILNDNLRVLDIIRQRHTLIYLLNNLNTNGKLEDLSDQLHQVEQGEPPSNELMIRLLAIALQENLTLPKYVSKIINLYFGLTELKNTHIITSTNRKDNSSKRILSPIQPFAPDYPVVYVPIDKKIQNKRSPKKPIIPITKKVAVQARLNLLTQEERLTTAEIFWLTSAIHDGSLLEDIHNQLSESIDDLTKHAPTINRFSSIKV